MTRFPAFLTPALILLAGCFNPYPTGEYNAGPVDPSTFPPEYLGAGGDRLQQGKGTFTAIAAYVKGSPVEYFKFSFSAGQLKASDPLALTVDGTASSAIPTPSTYVFDPAYTDPFPKPAQCKPPQGYAGYNPATDDVPYDEMGNIFTALPVATYKPGALPTTSYVPIVAQVPVTSNGEACQSLKSETTLVKSKNVTVQLAQTTSGTSVGTPDGRYLAWAVIDPGAAVFHVDGSPSTGVGIQKWGWFKKYLLAYLDGGYLPVTEDIVAGSRVLHIVTQKLYYPRSTVDASPGAIGQGYDVMEGARGDLAYSPVCAVFTYDTGAATPAASLPKDAATITSTYGSTLQPAPTPYVYCLQHEP